jgi:hypothetical protein
MPPAPSPNGQRPYRSLVLADNLYGRVWHYFGGPRHGCSPDLLSPGLAVQLRSGPTNHILWAMTLICQRPFTHSQPTLPSCPTLPPLGVKGYTPIVREYSGLEGGP